MQTQTITRPYMLAKDEGPALWGFPGFDMLLELKATAEQTGGVFGLVEVVAPPGAATPLHIHHGEDEAFYVLEGEVTFFSGEQRLSAGPGTFVWGPRAIPHEYRAEGTTPARLHMLLIPGDLDRFFVEICTPAPALTPPPTRPLDVEHALAVAPRYGIEILGPLPY